MLPFEVECMLAIESLCDGDKNHHLRKMYTLHNMIEYGKIVDIYYHPADITFFDLDKGDED